MIKSKTHIIAFVGMPGSGKSTAVNHLSKQGYPKVYFGGVVLQELEKAGIDRSPEAEANLRNELRQKNSKDFIAQQMIEQINNLISAGQHRIVADGLYSWTEYKTMKRAFPGELSVVAIMAPRHVRHRRLAARPERPFTHEEARVRDWREIEDLEKGGPIAIADHCVINDGTDIEAYLEQVESILKNIDF